MSLRYPQWCLSTTIALALFGCFGKSKSSSNDHEGKAAASSAADRSYVPPPQGLGTVEGVVLIEGDSAPVINADEQKIPADCDVARTMYPPLFREGPGRTLADAFVGVTGYKGDAREKKDPLPVEIKGCAFSARTYAIQSKQHFLVKSADGKPYSPILYGARSKASLIAVGNDPVPVFHRGPGQYVMYDEMRVFAQATVLVMNYPTFDVTGLDGKFRIEGVPAGASEVAVLLPSAKATTSQKITVERGRTTQVTLKVRFDAEAFKLARQNRNAPSAGAASVAPAVSAVPTNRQ